MEQSLKARLHTQSRRVPPGQSVSLRKGGAAPAARVQSSASQRSSDSSSLAAHRNSSGETSNVDVWFEKSNRRVGRHVPSLNDSDPPFSFDRNSGDPSPQRPATAPSPLLIPTQPHFPPNESSGSSSEEYRSVIDDLTIENKTLKRKLRRYERPHDPHLQKDKLFEVKVHGLAPEKKQELEELLRRFASGLNSPSPASAANAPPSTDFARLPSAQSAHKAASSLTSTRIADSGYGSLTTSGNHPTPVPGLQRSLQSNAFDKTEEMDRNIHSYLHDIPEGLMPKQSQTLSEKSKKKLVVRRLEQIFGGGRRSDPGLQQHPLQQQEVSQSAAKADRNDLEARGEVAKAEGVREARIMDDETEDPMDLSHAQKGPEDVAVPASKEKTEEEQGRVSGRSPPAEQRPTRPLDLDPHRAQNPTENIEYIKHLGFLDSGASPTMPAVDGHSWIYLNLLVSMAQLHTINVTVDFVKKALAEYSTKIELSSDGRKVRWRDSEGTMLSSDSSPDIHHESSSAGCTDEEQPGIKRPRPPYLDSQGSSAGHRSKKQALQPGLKSKFAYTPLFSRQESSEDESNASMCEEDYFPTSLGMLGDGGKSVLGGFKERLPSSSNTPASGGPMIFYNNANFCTDLSGDKSVRPQRPSFDRRQSLTSLPLGAPRQAPQKKTSSVQSSIKDSASSTFDVSELSSSLELAGRPDIDLDFPSDRSPQKHVSFAEPGDSMALEASGVGGVRPEDNVTITVLRQYEQTSPDVAPKARPQSQRFGSILSQRSQPKPRITEHVISAREEKVQPSPLPPASLHFAEEDSDSDSDASSEDSSADLRLRLAGEAGLSSQAVAFPYAPQVAGSPQSDVVMGDESSNDEDDEDEDQSLDFLATQRAADPEAVRAKEREYDAELAERLAEEIPAGSSAATAGGLGGSGFTSPSELAKREDNVEEEADEGGSVSS